MGTSSHRSEYYPSVKEAKAMQGRAEKVAWVQVWGFKNHVAELKEKLASIQAELLLVETKSEEQGLIDESDKIWGQEDQ